MFFWARELALFIEPKEAKICPHFLTVGPSQIIYWKSNKSYAHADVPFFFLRLLTETENQNLKATILFRSHSSNCFRYSEKKKKKKSIVVNSKH